MQQDDDDDAHLPPSGGSGPVDDDDPAPSVALAFLNAESAALSIAWCVFDVLGTLLLPLVLIIVVSLRSGKMPGKEQADIGMMEHGEMLK